MKNPIEAKKRVMGYFELNPEKAQLGLRGTCNGCSHVKRSGADFRCEPGGFYVRALGSCHQFDAARKVAIGPTDV